jgi:hypothetical protein
MDIVLEDLDFILSFHPISSIKKMILHEYLAIVQMKFNGGNVTINELYCVDEI